MKNKPILRIALIATLAALAIPASILAQGAAAKGPAPEGFSAEGGNYLAVAEALGKDASDAQEKARGAALGILMKGLGKDRLFAEVFVGSPPVGLAFALLSSEAEGGQVRARVSIGVDDESIRIIERGPYLVAAVALLDKAEKSAVDADDRASAGSAAESAAKLGEALVAYGMAEDSSRSGLALIENLSDASIFSSAGKRTAPELRHALETVRDSAAAGVGRVREAQAKLEADETGKAIGESVRRAMDAAAQANGLLTESEGILADPSSVDPERLRPLRDKLAVERRSMSDSVASLNRAKAALPKERGYRNDELDFALRRLSTVDAALLAAYRSVDREIRDPAIRRAARARTVRWLLLHSPTERLALRFYLPFAVEPSESEVFASMPFDLSLGAEGAFPLGQGGIWARTRVGTATTDFSSEVEGDEEFAVRQSFDVGIWRRALFFAGFAWDWYRGYGGERYPKPGQIEFGIGGVSERDRDDGLRRADWLLALSYEIPYSLDEFILVNVLNLGLEAQFRLGDVAILEASASERLHKLDADHLAAAFRWALGFGLRLPPPFTFGGEYSGVLTWPLVDGKVGDRSPGMGGAFRFYLGYSL